jgi:hypothetical protein
MREWLAYLHAKSKTNVRAVNFASHVSISRLIFTIEFILFAKTHSLVQNYSAVGAEDEAESSTTSPHTSRTWMGKPKV